MRRSRRRTLRPSTRGDSEPDPPTLASFTHAFQSSGWAQALVAISVLEPEEAGRRVDWTCLATSRDARGPDHVARVLAAQPTSWVERFVTSASEVPLAESSWPLAWVVRRAVLVHDLPCPTGEAFVAHAVDDWAGDASLTDRLRADPLMPDVLLGHLGSDLCGTVEGTAQATLALVADGTLDRSLLDRHLRVLQATPRRPRCSRTLAVIADGLGPA